MSQTHIHHALMDASGSMQSCYDTTLGSHLLFEERDRGDIVLGRVKAGVPPRLGQRRRGARLAQG